MDIQPIVYISFSFINFIIAAKWAMELGFSQFRQILCGIGGFLLGPIMLLILYIRLLHKAKATGNTSGNIF